MRTYVFQYDVVIAGPGGQDTERTYHGVKIEAETYDEARDKAVEYVSDQWSPKDWVGNVRPDMQTTE